MNIRKALPVQNNCIVCDWRSPGFFCHLPEDVLKKFGSLKITHAYPKGTVLFIEGQEANGIYVLCEGKIKLTTYSEDGRSMILRVAEPGEALGLSASVAGHDYECTAQAITDCQVNFVRTSDLLRFFAEHSEAAFNAIRDLSVVYHKAHLKVCSLGLASSVSDKLARLLLDWFEHSAELREGTAFSMEFTHEEIAEMIGTSRETVTRLLKIFRTQQLITLEKSKLFIPDRRRLEAVIGSNRVYESERCDDGHIST
ncbi:MAG: Crp/Fnr family transcriptional regulator [Chloracidobacterium sp.]|nr:Crp/Fnr family transcriptional regulator [Chloracidobacterium sp.]